MLVGIYAGIVVGSDFPVKLARSTLSNNREGIFSLINSLWQLVDLFYFAKPNELGCELY